MLDWLTGPEHDEPGEGPETPAHLFAARAFKTALFGTPAPPRDDDDKRGDEDFAIKLAQGRAHVSPAKGILLTPGTVGLKRKSVSFGATKLPDTKDEKEQNEEKHKDPASSTADTNTDDAASSANKPLRRNLFNKPKPFQAALKECTQEQASTAPKGLKTVPISLEDRQEASADVTIDLEQPRSISGRHWMKEYQRDHALSKVEMKKLIRYSQSAKLHASKRDREATKLREKLEKSESRVKELERENLELKKAKNLGRQVGGDERRVMDSNADGIGSSDAELSRLRKIANEASNKAAKLERENADFKKTILRVKEEMARYESRHKEWIEQRRRKDEKHAAQRKALKEKVINYRTRLQEEFDDFQRRANNDKAALLREIDFLRSEISSTSPGKFETSGSGEQLRQLLARIHEQPKENDRTRDVSPKKAKDRSPERRVPKAPLQRIRDEWQDIDEGSSPTILDSHIRRASKKSNEYSPAASRLLTVREGRGKEPPSPRPSLIPFSPARRDRNNENDLPVITRRKEGTLTTAKPGRGVHVRQKHGLVGRSNTRTGLTPEREAAAKLRIAQRSAEKQRSTKFLFENELQKENRDVLREKPLNMV